MTGASASRWRGALAPALLFAFGLGVSLYYGRRGYMPLDQSIVFDGGWRVLSGQVPFRDYHAPNGFTVHALQALAFALGGVNWLSYCLHAAVVNGLFAVLVSQLLARMGLYRWASYLWGALSALVLYPPFGVPYMDQHAFFFAFCGVLAAVVARQRGSRATWLAIPAILLMAGLAKQIPSVFAVPIVVAIACVGTGAEVARRLRWLALGSALAVGALVLLALVAGVDAARVDTYFRELPAEVGGERFGFVPGLGPLLERARLTDEVLGLRSIGLVHWAAVLALAALGALGWTARARRVRLLAPIGAALLAEALLLVCLLFVAFTSNQPQIGVPFVFAAAGLVHVALERARDGLLRGRRVWAAGVARVLGLALLAVGLADGLRFTGRVNATRVVNDLVTEDSPGWSPEAAALAAPKLHPALAFMGWQLPPNAPVQYGPDHLRDLVEFLAERDEPFLYLGDASVVYGLAGQPSAAPSLWFQHGMTLPRPDDPRLAAYEDLLLERIDALGVTAVVLEGQRTWAYTALDWFPRLEARVAAERAGSTTFGPLEVIELGPRD